MFGNSIKKIQKKKMFERKIEQNVQKKERNARVNDKNNKGITRRQAESVLYFTYLFLLNSRVFCYKFFFVFSFPFQKQHKHALTQHVYPNYFCKCVVAVSCRYGYFMFVWLVSASFDIFKINSTCMRTVQLFSFCVHVFFQTNIKYI